MPLILAEDRVRNSLVEFPSLNVAIDHYLKPNKKRYWIKVFQEKKNLFVEKCFFVRICELFMFSSVWRGKP